MIKKFLIIIVISIILAVAGFRLHPERIGPYFNPKTPKSQRLPIITLERGAQVADKLNPVSVIYRDVYRDNPKKKPVNPLEGSSVDAE